MPPPLCPGLLLQASEVRFGVPMHELAELTTQGELIIVGTAGDPLLRANVNRDSSVRSLEISMMESGNGPRATIAPPKYKDSNRRDSLGLEIRGLKGYFYGMLELRGSGACYVRKDGQTLMVIDGAQGQLQLTITSGLGAHMADAKVTNEMFGGSEHVEIRVQPGVDTVLVLACVLAVLLLAPSS